SWRFIARTGSFLSMVIGSFSTLATQGTDGILGRPNKAKEIMGKLPKNLGLGHRAYAASDRRLRFGALLPGVGFMSWSIASTSCCENRMDRPSRRCGQPPFLPCSYMRQRRQMVSTPYWCLCAMSWAVKYTSDFGSAMFIP